MLIQTYTITNDTSAAVAFDLYRYIDADISGILDNGGGHIVTAGHDVLFETDVLAGLDDNIDFVAITADGGSTPTSNRFEIGSFPGLLQRIDDGSNLSDDIYNDADDDGVIDAAYDVTMALRNSFSLGVGQSVVYVTRTIWGTDVRSVGESISQALAPPTVTEVTVSDSSSTAAAYNFSTVVGSGQQLKTVPLAAANRIAIKFSEDVSVTKEDLRLFALNNVATVPSVESATFVEPSWENDYTATWTFAFALPDAQYLISLSDHVTDLDGNHLDGEWTNPGQLSTIGSDLFPSGDGIGGGDFKFAFTTLRGDANQDLQVTAADLDIVLFNYNATGKNWSQGDFTGDGQVNGEDLAILSRTHSDLAGDAAWRPEDEAAVDELYNTLGATLN
jgi:hypothetical protein